jgi:hypothetical protein
VKRRFTRGATCAALATLACILAPAPRDAADPQADQPDKQKPFASRQTLLRDKLLRENGGTAESDAAVARGLKWLARQQQADGHWALDGDFPDQGNSQDIAGTAFGLLPMLGAGFNHQKADNNPYSGAIEKGLRFLMSKQDKRTGSCSSNMYAHALAAITLCEAYGMSQDPVLRKAAQKAVDFTVFAQHEAGGWRYSPKQPGDLSVTSWQVQVLLSARTAGLNVPGATLTRTQPFLDQCNDSKRVDPTRGDSEGYGYTGPANSPSMSAVGLLLREHLQGWDAQNARLTKGVQNWIQRTPPPANGAPRHMYYYYYATQVMHRYGGDAWTKWNESMRESLIRSQEKGDGKLQGSWDSRGDPHSAAGGRLMYTSLALLTLEVYYRYPPR